MENVVLRLSAGGERRGTSVLTARGVCPRSPRLDPHQNCPSLCHRPSLPCKVQDTRDQRAAFPSVIELYNVTNPPASLSLSLSVSLPVLMRLKSVSVSASTPVFLAECSERLLVARS